MQPFSLVIRVVSCWGWGRRLAALAALLAFCIGVVAATGGDVALRLTHAEAPTRSLPSTLFRVAVYGRPLADAGTSTALPITGATVTWQADLEGQRYSVPTVVQTGSDGEAELRSIHTGDGWLLVSAPGHARRSLRTEYTDGGLVEVLLPPAQQLTVEVVDEEERPVASATALVETNDPLPYGGLTDAEGRCSFSDLGPGALTLQVFAPGFESAQLAGVEDFQRVQLRRLGGLNIQVLDAEGAQASQSEIWIVGSSLWPARVVKTNAQGQAKIGGLHSGSYDLRARLGTSVSPVVSAVSLEVGEHKDVELRLGPGRFVRIQVRHETQGYPEAVSEAEVVLAELGISPFPLTGVSNEQGEVSLGPIALGPAQVSARASGFVGGGLAPVPETGVGPVVLTLQRGATLRGLVTDSDGRPIVDARVEVIGTDLEGLPVANTPLRAAYQSAHFQWSLQPMPLLMAGELGVTRGPVPTVNEALRGGVSWAELPDSYRPWTTNFEGRFKAFPVPAGRVRAIVRHPNYVEAVSDAITLAPGGSGQLTVTLGAGGKLLGRVLTEQDRPVAGARVRVSARRGSFERSTLTAADGTFVFAAVPQSIVLALARPDELTRFVQRTELTIRPGKERELELILPDPRPQLSVRVFSEGGAPLELVQLSLASLSPQVPLRETSFTDSRGSARFPDVVGLPAMLTLQAPGFAKVEKRFKALPEEVSVDLLPGVRVHGRVTAVRGRHLVEGARVELINEAGRQRTHTDAQGTYKFANVAAGKATLRASHERYATVTQQLSVERTGHRDRPLEAEEMDLPEPVNLSGTVVDAQGEVVAQVRISQEPIARFGTSRASSELVLSDREGHFELRRVAPGEVTLFAYHPDYGRGELRSQALQDQTGLELVLTGAKPALATDLSTAGGGLLVTLERQGASLVIVDVAVGSEAERAGLRVDDTLRSVDGVSVETRGQARTALLGHPGSDVIVVLDRDGEELSFRVRREVLTR